MKTALSLRSFGQLLHRSKRAARFFYPEREWFVGLTLGALALIAGGIYSALLFTATARYADEGLRGAAETASGYNGDDVARALEIYKTRRHRFEALRSQTPAAIPVVPAATSSTSSAAVAEGEGGG
jgi:hypothetical protein